MNLPPSSPLSSQYAHGILACVVALSLLGSPSLARADAIDDARSDGVLVGVGVPMASYGAASTISSIFTLASADVISTTDYIGLGLGLGQLGVGVTLLAVGESRRPERGLEASAFSAGSDIGSGATLITYGSLMVAGGIAQIIIEDVEGYDWVVLSLQLALGGVQIGYGAYLLSEGQARFDEVRARADAPMTVMSVPLWGASF